MHVALRLVGGVQLRHVHGGRYPRVCFVLLQCAESQPSSRHLLRSATLTADATHTAQPAEPAALASGAATPSTLLTVAAIGADALVTTTVTTVTTVTTAVRPALAPVAALCLL